MMGFGALFLLALVHLVVSQSSWDDPCYLRAWNPHPDPETGMIPLPVPDGCSEGEIHWSYPQGSLHLSATRNNSQFSLCVGESWATSIQGVNDITGGQNISLTMPTTDKAACAQSERTGRSGTGGRSHPDLYHNFYLQHRVKIYNQFQGQPYNGFTFTYLNQAIM